MVKSVANARKKSVKNPPRWRGGWLIVLVFAIVFVFLAMFQFGFEALLQIGGGFDF